MKIKLLPTQQEIELNPNKTLLQICTENKIEIKSICKGVPSCAECRVRIVEGEHNILPPSKAELSLIGTSFFVDQRRLACQVRCFGDVTVDISEQIERAEFQSKKVRGFRTPGQKGFQTQTLAKQGTLVLEEPSLPAETASNGEPSSGSSRQTLGPAQERASGRSSRSERQDKNRSEGRGGPRGESRGDKRSDNRSENRSDRADQKGSNPSEGGRSSQRQNSRNQGRGQSHRGEASPSSGATSRQKDSSSQSQQGQPNNPSDQNTDESTGKNQKRDPSN